MRPTVALAVGLVVVTLLDFLAAVVIMFASVWVDSHPLKDHLGTTSFVAFALLIPLGFLTAGVLTLTVEP